MKIELNKKPTGVVLIVALFVVVAAGIMLASYLTLMTSESRIVGRSQIWNQAVPVMEAGVEEAMAQIQYCAGTTNFGSNSWTLNGTNYYQKTRTNTDGSYYVVTIQPVLPPLISSTAYVPIPGTSTSYISRTVRVATTNGSGYAGLVAKSTITLSGTGTLDSFNSALYTNIAASADYTAYTSAYGTGTNAIAETLSTSSAAIYLGPKGSGHIYGQAITGPGGTVSVTGGGAGVGPTSSTGVQSGWTNNNANFQMTDIGVPNTTNGSWFTSMPSAGAIKPVTNQYTYLFRDGNYYINGSINLSGGTTTMGVSGNVVLYLTGSFTIANSAYVYIAPNSSLTLYLGGNFTNSGAGTINANGSTSAFTLYGLSTCTDIELNNGTAFVGTINAPEAAVNVTGNGGMYGQVFGNTISISGSGSVHYDQALAGLQFFNAYAWNEL